MANRIINLNTADPYVIGTLIGDYLEIRDYDTLYKIGLTNSLVNDLQRDYDRDPRGFPNAFADEYVLKQKILPPDDLDIPGDLYKIILKQSDDGYILNRRGDPFGFRSGLTSPARFSRTNYNNAYSQASTAPSYNRLLTLFDSYGGWQSFIMRVFLDETRYGDGLGFGPGDYPREDSGFFAPGSGDSDNVLRAFGEYYGDTTGRPDQSGVLAPVDQKIAEAGTRIKTLSELYTFKLPYGSVGTRNVFREELARGLYVSGVFAGFNYNAFLLPPERYNQIFNNTGVGNLALVAGYSNEFAPSDKLSVSSNVKDLPGDYGRLYPNREWPNVGYRRPTYRSWKYGTARIHVSFGLSFNDPNDANLPLGFIPGLVANYAGGRPDSRDGISVDLKQGPGTKRKARISNYEPVIEFPKVYDGVTFRPLEHPFGHLILNEDPDPAIEFSVEMAQHFEAIATWVEAGMPCDWPDWKNHVTPDLAEALASREAALLEEATRYIPTTTTSPTPPVGPRPGDQWFDTTTGKTKVWRETNPSYGVWVDA